jgi:hypothetical protein
MKPYMEGIILLNLFTTIIMQALIIQDIPEEEGSALAL